MNQLSSPENPILVLQRFNGFESYPIKLAEWNLYTNEENGMINLWISLSAGQAIRQQRDTKGLYASFCTPIA